MATTNNFTNYGANMTAAWLAGKSWYLALMTTATSKSAAGVEASAGNYARVAVTLNITGTAGQINNGLAINMGTPSVDWTTIYGVTLFDALTGGNAWFFYNLTSPQDCAAGVPVIINIGALSEILS